MSGFRIRSAWFAFAGALVLLTVFPPAAIPAAAATAALGARRSDRPLVLLAVSLALFALVATVFAL